MLAYIAVIYNLHKKKKNTGIEKIPQSYMPQSYTSQSKTCCVRYAAAICISLSVPIGEAGIWEMQGILRMVVLRVAREGVK